MYTGTSFQYRDSNRYKFNAHVILNESPSYISSTTPQDIVVKVTANVNNLRNVFKDQLTQRQYDALGMVMDNVLSNEMSLSDKMSIIELRFEGAGSYQNNSTDSPQYQSVNSNKVTPKSIDFKDFGGNHNAAWGTFTPDASFHTGKGLYGAMTVVYKNGDIMGVFMRTSTLPDQMDVLSKPSPFVQQLSDTIKPDTYKAQVGTHTPTGEKALNLRTMKGSSSIPTLIDHEPSPSATAATGVNAHKGYRTERGSTACQTIAPDDHSYWINLYPSSGTFKFIVKHLVNIQASNY